jgi:hypothetical protein
MVNVTDERFERKLRRAYAGCAGFGFRRHAWRNGPQQLSLLLRGNRSWGRGQSCRTRRRTFQEIPAVDS